MKMVAAPNRHQTAVFTMGPLSGMEGSNSHGTNSPESSGEAMMSVWEEEMLVGRVHAAGEIFQVIYHTQWDARAFTQAGGGLRPRARGLGGKGTSRMDEDYHLWLRSDVKP